MTIASDTAKAAQIRKILDQDLSYTELSSRGDLDEGAIRLFKKLFVEYLGFNELAGTWGEEIITDDWREESEVKRACILAESGDVRIVYLILSKLSRTAQRYAITSLVKEGWAKQGRFIAIFHAPQSDVWTMVSPYMAEGRIILQRFIAGQGENHRTLSENLAKMDVAKPEPLFDRVLEAFRVKVVTEEFYKDYKSVFKKLKEFLDVHLSPKEAKQYAHLLLNRLMFVYYLQKKRWLAGRKDFMGWYLEQYRNSQDKNLFHSKWLNALFFEAMSKPENEKMLPRGMPEDVASALQSIPFFNGGLFERHPIDDYKIRIPDDLIFKIIEGFLERYNFTVTEESPFDVDVAVDPAMLGKIYESLIAEEERGKAGIFYTPRVEVDLMCRLGLLEYLTRERKFDDSTEGKSLKKLVQDRKKIIDFLFTPIESWKPEKAERFKPLERLLESVTVCDPACGSGAFLVGMLQVLTELYYKLGIEANYGLKESIIERSIYGADIKDWAIRMAEFRLWLALIESETDVPRSKPVLPNFSFNLKVGDSIVQKIGDEYLNLDLTSKLVSSQIETDRKEIEKLRKRYYYGEKYLENKIYEKQLKALEAFIDRRIERLKQERSTTKQVNLQGEVSEESSKAYDRLSSAIKELENQRQQLKEAGSKRKFIWGLDFLGPMLDGGFDIVIANPPYVRHENIIDPKLEPEETEGLSASQLKKLKDAYKSYLQEYAKQIWGEHIGGRVDIYVSFFLKGIELAKQLGVLVFVSSNSWLDVDFGKYLQSFLLRYSNTRSIIDNSAKRSFEEADINTVITVALKKEKERRNVLDAKTLFINFRVPFEAINTTERMRKALDHSYSYSIDYEGQNLFIQKEDFFRKVILDGAALWKLGGGNFTKIHGEEVVASAGYEGNKWGGKFVRAPDIFFTILKKGEGKLVELGDIAEVRRGFTTGANEFFYLKPVEMTVKGVAELRERDPKAPVRVENGAGWEGKIEAASLRPVIKSPREIKTLRVRLEDLQYLVFMPPADVRKAIENGRKQPWRGYPLAADYIRWGETAVYVCRVKGCGYRGEQDNCPRHGKEHVNKDAFPERPTCASRPLWWSCPEEAGNCFWGKELRERLAVFSSTAEMNVDCRLYVATVPIELQAILNSAVTILFDETTSRQLGGGGGPRSVMVYEVQSLNCLDPSSLTVAQRKRTLQAFEPLVDRRIKTVFEELGLPKPNNDYSNIDPEDVSLDKVMPDRRELDKVIFEALGLTEDEQLQVYKAIVELVKARLVKARSV